MKLFLSPLNIKYIDLMKFVVCDLENKECMIQRCPECPHTDEPLVEHLKEVLGDCDDDETIQFSQWTTTDRSTMIQQQEKVPEYINLIVSQLHRLKE